MDSAIPHVKADSNCKIVFKVEEDIHKMSEKLLDKNVAMREIKTFADYNLWLCDGEDPEGNIFQPKKRKTETNQFQTIREQKH